MKLLSDIYYVDSVCRVLNALLLNIFTIKGIGDFKTEFNYWQVHRLSKHVSVLHNTVQEHQKFWTKTEISVLFGHFAFHVSLC